MKQIGEKESYNALMIESNYNFGGWQFWFTNFVPGEIPSPHHEEFVSFVDDHFSSEDILRFFLWSDFIVWKKTIHCPYSQQTEIIDFTPIRTLDKIMGIKRKKIVSAAEYFRDTGANTGLKEGG